MKPDTSFINKRQGTFPVGITHLNVCFANVRLKCCRVCCISYSLYISLLNVYFPLNNIKEPLNTV